MFLDVTLKHVLLFDMVLNIVYMWVSHDIVVPIPICLCLHVGFMEKGLKRLKKCDIFIFPWSYIFNKQWHI